MPKDQNRQKQVIMHKFTFLTHNPTWMFRRRQGKCYKIATFANPTKQILCFRLKPLKELFHSTNRKRLCF